MAEGLSRRSRIAGLVLACGGMALIGLPGATAPQKSSAARKPARRKAPASPIPSVPATPPLDAPIMKVSEIRPGMKAYGYTVFHGTRIERFDVDIVGVMEKANMGQPLGVAAGYSV